MSLDLVVTPTPLRQVALFVGLSANPLFAAPEEDEDEDEDADDDEDEDEDDEDEDGDEDEDEE